MGGAKLNQQAESWCSLIPMQVAWPGNEASPNDATYWD